jgi:hypothetical protein
VRKAENTTIDSIARRGEAEDSNAKIPFALVWSQTDWALPMPFETDD